MRNLKSLKPFRKEFELFYSKLQSLPEKRMSNYLFHMLYKKVIVNRRLYRLTRELDFRMRLYDEKKK